jgi:hypothetical protein
MKKAIFVLLSILLIRSRAGEQPVFTNLSALMQGTWIMKLSSGQIGETWKKINDNELRSAAFKVKEQDTAWLEKVQLVSSGEGIFYIPTIKDQNQGKPVRFKLTSSENNQFVFSNPEHDFPQRVVYQFVSRDSLHAWVDGKISGQLEKEDYYYKRTSH